MSMPTFLIVGAMKAGTTTLYRLLDQHPDVYVSPIKEPNFFAYRGGRPKQGHPPGMPYPVLVVDTAEAAREAMGEGLDAATFTTLEAYQALFVGVRAPQSGEASVRYLYLPHVARSIADTLRDVKVIAILRNPVERAYSHFLMARRMGREPLKEFGAAVEAEGPRMAQDYDPFWHYVSHGLYYQQLTRYYEHFDESQIRVILSEDLRTRTEDVLTEVCRFLGIDDGIPVLERKEFNIGGLPRIRWMYEFARRSSPLRDLVRDLLPEVWQTAVLRRFVMTKPPIQSEVRQRLTDVYWNDIISLEELIGRDLSTWK